TIEPGGILRAINLTNDGTLTQQSGAALLIEETVEGDNYLIERITTFDENTGRYSIMGSPVTVGKFDSLTTSGFLFTYDETELFHPNGNRGLDRFKAVTGSDMMVGEGYFSAFTGDENGKMIFKGTPNITDVSVAVTRTDHSVSDVDEEPFEGFALISNPYTVPLSYSSLFSGGSNADFTGAIYLWAEGTEVEGNRQIEGDYITVSSMGSSGGSSSNTKTYNGFIGVAQGFFVQKNTVGSGDFDFTAPNVSALNTAGKNDDENFFRSSESVEDFHKVRLFISSDQHGDHNTLLGFGPAATSGFDHALDAPLFTFLGSKPKIYTLMNDEKMAIQALPESTEEISVGIYAPEDGTFTIAFSETHLRLFDQFTGTIYEAGDPITLTLKKGTYNDRFTMVNAITNTTSALGEQWYSGIDNQQLSIVFNSTNPQQEVSCSILSLSGTVVLQDPHIGEHNGRTIIDLGGLPPSVYVLSVVRNGKSFTGKIILD
ncbi:MAG: T9SS type A sorting domain-containing protein, partial [Bacteroidota bacterium]